MSPGAAIPFELNEDFRGVFTEAALEDAPVGDLRSAIGCLTRDFEAFAIWLATPANGDEDITLFYDEKANDLRAVVFLDVEHETDQAVEASLSSLLAPIERRWSARTVLAPDPIHDRWLTVQATLADSARPASDLIRLGAEIRAALLALRRGALTLQSAYDLVVGGHAGALVGAREGGWLDAKGAPYRLSEDQEAWELAKDVAAFANLAGGLILIPATTRVVRGVEVIDRVKTLQSSSVDEGQHRDVIAARVYPAPVGIQVAFVEDRNGRGQFFVHVPPQPESRKPFLVRGALVNGRVRAHGVTVPWRDDDLTRYDDIGTIHAALRAYRSRMATDDQLMERMWLESMPPLFRCAVDRAREVGLPVTVMHEGFAVQLPDGTTAELATTGVPPGAEALAMHSVMQQLAEHGVPVQSTSGGFLIPAFQPHAGSA